MYIQTSETHAQLDTLKNAQTMLTTKIIDLENQLRQTKEQLQNTKLQNKKNPQTMLTTKISDLEDQLRQTKEQLQIAKIQHKENQKNIEKHVVRHENMRFSCSECGFVEKILEDIKPSS